ncbi:ACT domain-containing protein [Pseudoxanthomonas sp. CAU 1598]|uniref:ACT domain-containing protein n=2 Tax=Pseudomarimonas arenosa TaxID=2774145 RepID=A0AAW3ZUT9_9GAMM|nr:ACT domain-containing protein [Pseudomarimonas arenosa]
MLQALNPRLHPGCYVYACLTPEQAEQAGQHYQPLASFRETEAVTWIVPRTDAERHRWRAEFPCAWIQLDVHSALHAVGLTAAIATALAEHKLSCNIVAAYHHDHLFVPEEQAQQALRILKALQASQRAID